MESGGFSVALEAPYGYVYEIINLINGKTYVGSRKLSLDRYWRQYMGSGKLIKQAILKYDAEHFRKRFIAYAPTAEELYELETDWIIGQQLKGLAQYNLFVGGHAGGDTFSKLKSKTLEEVRRKQSEGMVRHFASGGKSWNTGKTAQTDERLRAQAEKAIARGTYRGLNLGSKRTDEVRTKMALIQLGNKNSQINTREDNRVRIGLTNKRKVLASGLTGIELHDQMLAAIENFTAGENLKELARRQSFSYTRFRTFSYAHGSTDRGEECLLCIARDRYTHLLESHELIASTEYL